MSYTAVYSDHPGDWHREQFRDFDLMKRAVGEPTPHMELVRWLCQDVPDHEKLWRAGLYAAGYSVLTAEAIWTQWPLARYLAEERDFLPWLRSVWPGIHTRTPRRVVRVPDKFAACVASYARWSMNGGMPRVGASYDEWWQSASEIAFMGRYIIIRLLELYRRWGFMKAELYDIRAMDAESPIRCLALLLPERGPEILSGNRQIVDRAAEEVIAMSDGLGYFRFAALLCEYRKSYEKRGDYPGNQTDEELGYWTGKYGDFWRERDWHPRYLEARAALVDARALGEDNGWSGQRELAARSLRDFGVNWSDTRFDYAASLKEGRPVEWVS